MYVSMRDEGRERMNNPWSKSEGREFYVKKKKKEKKSGHTGIL